MAKSLGLGLVAEGVELREQLEYLASLDCDAYQGYYFSRPLPATAATALLMEQNRDAQMMARAD
jgi:diguanylate cyclase